MNHLFWAIPSRLAGRCGPRDMPWSLHALRSAGIDTILSVADNQCASAEIRSAGFIHCCVPFPAVVPPDLATECTCRTKLPDTSAFIKAELGAGRSVLVHCAAGRDRTAMVIAHYLATCMGVSARQAITVVRHHRPDALAAEGWEVMTSRIITEARRR